jgi:hypothetical protein
MKLDEWRKSRIEQITLPSGLEVKVRKVNMLDAAMNGELPNPLLEIAMQAQAGAELTMTQIFTQFGPLINHLTALCLVEPAVAAKADAQHIAVTELSNLDRLEIFNRMNAEVLRLVPFLPKGNKPGTPISDGRRLRDKAKPPAGDKKPVGGLDAG